VRGLVTVLDVRKFSATYFGQNSNLPTNQFDVILFIHF